MKTVWLYGGGGHAKVILDCLWAEGASVAGVFDDNPAVQTVLGISILGAYNPALSPALPLIIAVGHNATRQKLAAKISHCFGKAAHPTALLSPYAQVKEGAVLLHRSVVQAGSVIGCHVIVNMAATVEHDCLIADFAHIAPGAVVCGGVQLGEGTLVGANATVLPGIWIGKACVIGAGSVVTRSLPDGSLVAGVPARILKKTNEA